MFYSSLCGRKSNDDFCYGKAGDWFQVSELSFQCIIDAEISGRCRHSSKHWWKRPTLRLSLEGSTSCSTFMVVNTGFRKITMSIQSLTGNPVPYDLNIRIPLPPNYSDTSLTAEVLVPCQHCLWLADFRTWAKLHPKVLREFPLCTIVMRSRFED